MCSVADRPPSRHVTWARMETVAPALPGAPPGINALVTSLGRANVVRVAGADRYATAALATPPGAAEAARSAVKLPRSRNFVQGRRNPAASSGATIRPRRGPLGPRTGFGRDGHETEGSNR